MTQRRVVITGLGIVAPNGIGKAEFWRNLMAGKSAVDRVFSFDASRYPCQVAAEVRDFSPTDFVALPKAKTMSRFSQFAVAATRLALEDAKLSITPRFSDDVAITWGSAVAGSGDMAPELYRSFCADGPRGIPAPSVLEYPAHQAAAHLAAEFKVHGPALSISTHCCTGLDAIYAAYAQIKLGKVKASVAGGSDAPIFPETFAAFCSLGALTSWDGDPQAACRPYDRHRDGIVLSEGGAALMLEDLEFALARGARIYAEVFGQGAATETGGPRREATGRAMARAIRAALNEGAVDPAEIDHINAHGSAIPHFDVCETNAFKQTLGERAYQVPVTSIKSMIGQGLAAAGVLQTAAACLAIEHQRVPPTINQNARDPLCDLDYVPNVSRSASVNRVLLNGQATGGSYAALVIGRPRSFAAVCE